MVNSLSLFLDTMVFLHYPLFTELDWLDMTGVEEVEIIISSVVFYELDEHKDKNNHQLVSVTYCFRTPYSQCSGRSGQAV